MSNFQRILVVIVLSIAVIFISGILLPKYLSSQILELRKELNSQNIKPKYTLEANLVPIAENRIQNESKDLMSNQILEAGEQFQSLNNSIQSQARVRKRSKRQADPEDYFNWKMNFNLTGKRNYAVQGSPDIASSTSEKDKYLNIAVFTDGEAKKKSAFAEIKHNLRVLEYFFKYLLSSENSTQEEIEKEHSRSGGDLEDFDGSGDETHLKGREGKFFNLGSFNIFGFRRSPEKLSTVRTIAETDSVFKVNEMTTQSPSNVIIENPKEMPNFQSQSLVSEMFNVINASNNIISNLPGKTEDGECIDCKEAGLQMPITSEIVDQSKNDLSEIKNFKFTDEFLEMFCMSLVNKVGVSQHLSDSEDSILKQNTEDEHILNRSENGDLDLLSISDSTEHSNFLGEESARTNTLSDNMKRRKLLNFVSLFGFGSGRSSEDIDESNELLKNRFADIDLENLPTLVDCENHFRKKNLKMFPKPNLMDILSDPKIKFADFANATISSKLIEQQLEFLTGLLKTNLDSGSETFGKNSEFVTKAVFNEISDNESTLNSIPKEMLNDLGENLKASMTSTSITRRTDFEKDSRFFGIFGFGSGILESRSLELLNSDTNEVIGSGDMRSLRASTSVNDTNELGSGESLSLWAVLFGNRDELGSGNLRSLDNALAFRDERNEFGSGDSRLQVAEMSDIHGKELEIDGSRTLKIYSSETFRNEFGSGDSRSLETVFKTEVNELGSGKFKSLDATSETEIGSGDFRLFKDSTSEILGKDIGSGDFRSFDTTSVIEGKDIGSGDFRSIVDMVEIVRKDIGSGDFRSLYETTSIIGRDIGSGDFRSHDETTSIIGRDIGSGDFRSFEDITPEIEGKDIASGDFRSLENTTPEIDGKNMGSGDFRSFQDITSEMEGKDMGSGDLELFKHITSEIQRKDIGSGDFRSFENVASEIEGNKFGSGSFGLLENSTESRAEFGSGDHRSFESENSPEIENASSGHLESLKDTTENEFGSDDSFKEKDLYRESQSSNKERFWGVLEFAGSGDGRELSVNTSFPADERCENCSTEFAEQQHEKFINNSTSHKDASTENLDSSKAQNAIERLSEQSTEKNVERFLRPVFLTGSGEGGLFGDSGGTINLLEEESKGVNSGSDSLDEMNSKVQNESDKFLGQTKNNTQRFLRPIFLTGSGDGGLFEDSGRPINLLEEEESTIKSLNSSVRRARLDDIPSNISEVSHGSSVKLSEQIEHSIDSSRIKITSPIVPSKRGRLDDPTDVICDDCEYDYDDLIENFRKKQNLDSNNVSKFQKRKNMESDKIPLNNENKISVTVLPDVIRSNDPVFPDLSKSLFQTRPCTAARECNVTLNERCISINSSRVCGCSKGYARNKQTSKCTVKKIVETSLKLPGEHFNEDLNNPFSDRFQQKRKSSIELAIMLLQNDPELLQLLSEIDVVKFSSGSLIVTLNLVFVGENKTEEQLVKNVENNIQIALQNEALTKIASLDVSDAVLISVNGEIDYCKSSELNYCSENAYCVSNPALPASYSCHCKEHYRDVSLNPRHIGEACIAKCPKEYCGLYGHCELLPNDEKVCLCSGLYFGRRCEVPGLYVLIALAFVGFVSLTMLMLVVFKKRCSGFSYREAQGQRSENGMNSHMNGRVSDAIALEENIGTTKFITISTPIPHPAINIIRPTVTESGSSYEFDSTFDSTPSTRKVEENSTV